MNEVTEIELPEFFLSQINQVHAKATQLYGQLDQRALDLLERKKEQDAEKALGIKRKIK